MTNTYNFEIQPRKPTANIFGDESLILDDKNLYLLDRELAQAEDEGFASTLRGVVWRSDAVFESGASVPADRLALAGQGAREI